MSLFLCVFLSICLPAYLSSKPYKCICIYLHTYSKDIEGPKLTLFPYAYSVLFLLIIPSIAINMIEQQSLFLFAVQYIFMSFQSYTFIIFFFRFSNHSLPFIISLVFLHFMELVPPLSAFCLI